jgi:hypothetical protein
VTATRDYTSLSSNGNLRLDWYATNAFAVWNAPTVTELNAGLNMSKTISWSDFGFGMNASNTSDDPSIADTGHTKTRGSAQFGGAISFYQPGLGTLSTDSYRLVRDAVGVPRTTGYIVERLDGAKAANTPYAAGDIISVFKVETDAQTNSITGEEAFRYTVKFGQQGSVARNVVVRSGTVTVLVTPSTQTVATSTHPRLRATVNGREYTNGVVWTSSDNTKVTVSSAGVLTWVASGSATITATYPPTGATATSAVTAS